MISVVQDFDATRSITPVVQEQLGAVITAFPVVTDPPVTPTNVWNLNILSDVSVTTYSNYFIGTLDEQDGVPVENLTPELATFNAGSFTLNDPEVGGWGVVLVKHTDGRRRSVACDFRISGDVTVRGLDSYDVDTLPELLSRKIRERVVPGKTATQFSSYNHATAAYTPDVNCWAYGINLTGCPVAATTQSHPNFADRNRGAAVTRRHIVGAKHYNVYGLPTGYEPSAGYGIGTGIRFLDADGAIHERTVIGRASYRDLIVATLSGPDLPVGITPLKIVGDWIFDLETAGPASDGGYSGGLIFWINQVANVYYMLLGSPVGQYFLSRETVTINSGEFEAYVLGGATHSPTLEAFSTSDFRDGLSDFLYPPYGGDSGSAVMVLLPNDEPCLLWTW